LLFISCADRTIILNCTLQILSQLLKRQKLGRSQFKDSSGKKKVNETPSQ
jgi:hypothetical protein